MRKHKYVALTSVLAILTSAIALFGLALFAAALKEGRLPLCAFVHNVKLEISKISAPISLAEIPEPEQIPPIVGFDDVTYG